MLFLSSGAISQAVSRRLPTVAAWVQSQVRLYGIFGGQNDMGCRFSLITFFFPLAILCQTTVSLLLTVLSSTVNILDIGSVVK
jgi:hypothetical protein